MFVYAWGESKPTFSEAGALPPPDCVPVDAIVDPSSLLPHAVSVAGQNRQRRHGADQQPLVALHRLTLLSMRPSTRDMHPFTTAVNASVMTSHANSCGVWNDWLVSASW